MPTLKQASTASATGLLDKLRVFRKVLPPFFFDVVIAEKGRQKRHPAHAKKRDESRLYRCLK